MSAVHYRWVILQVWSMHILGLSTELAGATCLTVWTNLKSRNSVHVQNGLAKAVAASILACAVSFVGVSPPLMRCNLPAHLVR